MQEANQMVTYSDIEAKRQRLGLSRADMCRRAGISESTVYKGLADGRKPNPVILNALQAVLTAEQERVA